MFDCRQEELIIMTHNILEWMDSDDEEVSKIKCGPDELGGKFHVNIYVAVRWQW